MAVSRRGFIKCGAALLTLLLAAPAGSVERTWNFMPTGNGHGFQVFDREKHRIVTFLEHPYRYVAPGDAQRTSGVGRRDLAHDLYLGIRVGNASTWLHGQTNIEYEAQTHIIHGSSTHSGVGVNTYYFAPFGYHGNAMVMLISATNNSAETKSVSFFSKPNLKLGSGRTNPNDNGESVEWNTTAPKHGVETGPGGGHAVYLPIGEVDAVGCGKDGSLYDSVKSSGSVGSKTNCTGNGQVLVLKRNVSLEAGKTAWWGTAVLFVNDNPAGAQAADFKDYRTVDDIVQAWSAFIGERSAENLHADALAEFETWRSANPLPGLTSEEGTLWRQSETILRLGQVREPLQSNRENFGMILASLPPGEWHTGWVRDGVYAIVALAMTGHTDEAKLGTEFLLGADGATGGFFQSSIYLKKPYRISVCRYFGNGKEEGDFNNEGPNIETDGWGLTLWGARMVLHYSCDMNWLDQKTWRGDTVFEALHQVAKDLEYHTKGNLPEPDNSIWEVHWNRRQVFAYTAATQIRGFFDFAAIADAYGRADLGEKYRGLAQAILDTSKAALVYQPLKSFASHLGVSGNPVHVDGSTVEFLSWGLVEPTDPIYTGTMNQYSKLLTNFGGYRRLEPQLSLTGGGSATEYDLSEWILLDLRIGESWRRAGNTSLADVLLNKVTDAAAVNDFLIPELYDAGNGRYTGVVPMVGYGAGAWMMAQLEKHGQGPPAYWNGFDHCNTPPVADGDTGTTVPDGGSSPITDTAAGPPPPGTTDKVKPWTDGPALICTASTRGTPPMGWLWILLATIGALALRRRREAAQ